MPENVEGIQVAINEHRQLTGQELEADLGILEITVYEILTQDLGMKHTVAKFILRVLLPEQKDHCAAVANDLIRTVTDEPGFLKKVLTLKGNKVSLSYEQCFLCLVSSSINVSIFQSAWPDTFWTDLVLIRSQTRQNFMSKKANTFFPLHTKN